MKALRIAISALALVGFVPAAFATDPPHNAVSSIKCTSCHQLHKAPGGTITRVKGNANLCMSCHTIGGTASAHSFSVGDQGMPAPGLPAGVSAAGTSHRWDSGASGRVAAVAPNTSTGTVESAGAYTGVYAKAYTITITTPGIVGVARFGWTATSPPGGSGVNIVTAASVALDQGIAVTFTNGSGTSFVFNDKWYVYVRPDINQPTSAPMTARVSNGKIMCSTCHDVHSQAREPFGVAPAYSGAGTGAGRHFQRIANHTNLMCTNCHAARNVTASSAGSHPVGVAIPAGAYRNPTLMPLDKTTSNVRCSSCHTVHYAPTADGKLLRASNVNSICTDCHTLADTASPASHLLNTNANTLWPGGQYGTTFPAITGIVNQGSCGNCHQSHGWPDTANTAVDYVKLLVESQPNLCFTCHDGIPASNQKADFDGTIWATSTSLSLKLNTHHDVKPADQTVSGAVIGCKDCHNVHRATTSAKAVADPDPGDGRVPAPGQTWPTSDLRSEWCLDCHDGSLPPTITPPTVALKNVRSFWHVPLVKTADVHGSKTGNPQLRSGTGWVVGDVVPCTACHDRGHGSSNLFQLRTTVYGKDGTTIIGSNLAVTDLLGGTAVNGYNFCNTCHNGFGMTGRTDCFRCHSHGSGNF